MHAMTEAQAQAEGLTVLPGDLAAAPTVVDRLATASLTADALAAVVEALLAAGRVRRSDLLELSAGLGALHVELDDLADERRQLDHPKDRLTLCGFGSGKTDPKWLTVLQEAHQAHRDRDGVGA